MATVLLIGTLDTKGDEYAYLAERLRGHGVDVLVADAGTRRAGPQPASSRTSRARRSPRRPAPTSPR